MHAHPIKLCQIKSSMVAFNVGVIILLYTLKTVFNICHFARVNLKQIKYASMKNIFMPIFAFH